MLYLKLFCEFNACHPIRGSRGRGMFVHLFLSKIFDYHTCFTYYLSEMDGMRMCFVFLIFSLMMIFVFITNSTCLYENINRKISSKKTPVKRHMRENGKLFKKRMITQPILSRNHNETHIKSRSIAAGVRLQRTDLQKRHVRNTNEHKTSKQYRNAFFRTKITKKRGNFLNKTIGLNTSATSAKNSLFLNSKNNTFCTFSIEKSTIMETKRKIIELQEQSVHLFYINLYTEAKLDSFSEQERDNLLHWQYVLKKEKFLLLLPVDFDVLSLGLIFNYNGINALRMKIDYNNSICTKNVLYALRSLEFLLWNELFANDTGYFLCNRKFGDEHENLRMLLYVMTTAWFGHDMTCSTAFTKVGEKKYEADKGFWISLDPIFCFLLSLQFVWVFLILDISYKNKENCGSTNARVYTRNERPYGLKQFIFKLVFYKYEMGDCQPRVTRKWCCEPSTRVILVLLIFNTMFGLYRTLGRFFYSKYISDDYLDIVRPSEWFFYLFSGECFPALIVCLDVVYAVGFPFTFLWLGGKLYTEYLSSYPHFLFKNENDEVILNSFSDRFIVHSFSFGNRSRVTRSKYKLYENVMKAYFKIYTLYCCYPFLPFSCNAYKVCKCRCKCCRIFDNGICKCLWIFLAFVFLYIFSLRPIISTFTFVFRSVTYIVFVALPIRPNLFRFFILLVTLIVYYVRYIHEVINMNAEILDYIFQIKEIDENEQTKLLSSSIEMEGTNESKTNYVTEAMFDAIYGRLFFVRKRLYFLYVKTCIVTVYLLITVEVLQDEPIPDFYFQEMLVLFVAASGPYAISLFLKANKDNYLSTKNKSEIEREYAYYTNKTSNREENIFFPSDSDDSDELQDFNERQRLIQCNMHLDSYHSIS